VNVHKLEDSFSYPKYIVGLQTNMTNIIDTQIILILSS